MRGEAQEMWNAGSHLRSCCPEPWAQLPWLLLGARTCWELTANMGGTEPQSTAVVFIYTPSCQPHTCPPGPEESLSSLTTWGYHRAWLRRSRTSWKPKGLHTDLGGETQIYSKNPNKLEGGKLETEFVNISNHWVAPAVQVWEH